MGGERVMDNFTFSSHNIPDKVIKETGIFLRDEERTVTDLGEKQVKIRYG